MQNRQIPLLLILAVLWAAGCRKPETTASEAGKKAPDTVVLTPGSVEADPGGGMYTVTVTAPFRPSVGGAPTWVEVQWSSFDTEKYTTDLTLHVSANGPRERTAELIVSAGSLRQTLVLTQAGAPVPETDKSRISPVPTNPKAGIQARKLYSFLLDQYGNRTLSGAHSASSHYNDYVNLIYDRTGRHPALASYDFIFLQYSPTPSNWEWKRDYTDISEQKEHWNAGGIPCYMWHWNAPKDEVTFRQNLTGSGGYGFYCPGSNNGESETPFDIREALKEGTWQHEFILADLDEVAITFQKLKDEGIPVLFRPLHEAAGNYTRYNPAGGAWFWWGRYGASCCKQLWALMRERLENYHGLDNILWVWTVNVAEGYEDAAMEWYPGENQVDILGIDTYRNDTGLRTDAFRFLQSVCGGKKMLTLSECGNIPSPEMNILDGAPWLWFDAWPKTKDNAPILSGYGELNTESYWKSLMNSPRVLTRETMPSLK